MSLLEVASPNSEARARELPSARRKRLHLGQYGVDLILQTHGEMAKRNVETDDTHQGGEE
jgi:hypothetical protein